MSHQTGVPRLPEPTPQWSTAWMRDFIRVLQNWMQRTSNELGETTGALNEDSFVFVKDYGAVGDGVTDDSAAIQAALESTRTAWNSAGGVILWFSKPSVSYLIGTAIDLTGFSNITFQGPGGCEMFTGNSTKLEAGPALTGPMFTCDTSLVSRSGAFTFSGLHFDGNQQDVDAFYIHASVASEQARFIKFDNCGFESLRLGIRLGDYENETPNPTYLLGVDVYRCLFFDCVRPIVTDAFGLDALTVKQVWIVDTFNRMTRAISVGVLGGTYSFENVWLACGQNVTEAIYSVLANTMTIRDCAIEANDAASEYTAIYMGGSFSSGALVVDNTRIFYSGASHPVAGQNAIDVSNESGCEIRSCYLQGNVKVGPSMVVHATNVTFTSTYGFTTNPQNVIRDGSGAINVRSFGAVGDGVTDDTAAVLAAITAVKAIGGGKIVFPTGNYFFGTHSASATLLPIADLENVTFECDGSEFHFTISGASTIVTLFSLFDPYNVTFIRPRIICSGDDITVNQFGGAGILCLVSDGAATPVGKVSIIEPHFEGLVSTFFCAMTAPGISRRIKNLRLTGGVIKNCYYGPNFQQAGDDFIGDWTCSNIRRAYFPYGVRGHRVRIAVENTTIGYAADACIPIATQPVGTDAAPEATQDIHVDATFRGALTYWTGLVVFYHVGATTPQIMKDISVFLNLTDVVSLSGTLPFYFKSHVSSGGAEETTTTQNIWKNIRIDALTSEAEPLAGTAAGLIYLGVSPTTPADIHLGLGMQNAVMAGFDGTSQLIKSDNWLFYTGLRTFLKAKIGDLTAAAMTIDLSALETRKFTLLLKMWATLETDVLSGQGVTYKEVVVTGYNAGGGAVAISQQDDVLTHSTGTASTITVAASGETLTISFTNYNNAKSRAFVECELKYPLSVTLA